ncbi:MAG: PBECR2 nuclease fold domain-containing protein [Halobacteriales archaeon]
MHRFSGVSGRDVRLTDERLDHIESRPEMEDQLSRIEETLADPDELRESNQDETVRLYYRHYAKTPVTEKYLLVVAKAAVDDPFVITAFFTDRIKSGRAIDPTD